MVPKGKNRLWVVAEAEMARSEGKETRSNLFGNIIIVNQQRQFSPGPFSFSLTTGSGLLRGGVALTSHINIEAIGGVGVHVREIEGRVLGQTEHHYESDVGSVIGIQLGVAPGTRMGGYGRWTATYGIDGTLTSVEAGGTWNLTPHIALFGGWRYWEYREMNVLNTPPINFKLSGPLVGMWLTF